MLGASPVITLPGATNLTTTLDADINLLKTKRNLLYIRNQSVPRSKHFLPRLLKTNQLMTYKTKAAVCSDIRTKHSTQSEGHAEFLNVKTWWYVKKPLGFKSLKYY